MCARARWLLEIILVWQTVEKRKRRSQPTDAVIFLLAIQISRIVIIINVKQKQLKNRGKTHKCDADKSTEHHPNDKKTKENLSPIELNRTERNVRKSRAQVHSM